MERIFSFILAAAVALALAACGGESTFPAEVPTPSADVTVSAEPAEELKQEEKGEKDEVNRINVSFNGHTYTAALADNSSARAFVQLMEDRGGAVTIPAHDYGSFEKVGPLGTSIVTNDEDIYTVPGDIILYQGSNVCLYYANNSWDFTRLGKLEGDLESLKADLGSGDVEITYSLGE